MDAVSLLVHLVFKTFFLSLPIGVAWLAFRRLSMSESRNSWLYAGVGLLASFAAAGLAPWGLGFAGASWAFLLMALACPAIWLATVVYCDLQHGGYNEDRTEADTMDRFKSKREPVAPAAPARLNIGETTATTPTLLLQDPSWPKPAVPLFRHRAPDVEPPLSAHRTARPKSDDTFDPLNICALDEDPAEVVSSSPKPAPAPHPLTPRSMQTTATNSAHRKVLDVARDMRGDRSSSKRRPKPDTGPDLPFLPGTA